MRLQSIATLFCVALLGSGCATSHLARQAREHPDTEPATHPTKVVPGNKAVWVLAPVTVAWDVATAPVLGLGMLWLWVTGYDEC